MKKIAIIKKKEVLLGILAVFLIGVGFMSYTPNMENDYGRIADVQNYSEKAGSLGEATLVSSNSVEETDTQPEKTEEELEIEAEEDKKGSYFLEAKMERDNTYSETLEIYEKILESSSVTNDQKTIAQNEIANISNEKKTISITENLIKMKGFEDVVIFKNSNGISVIIKSDVLLPEQVAQIQNIVEREFQTESKNINITNK